MSNRLDIINRFYDGSGEDDRLSRSRHGQLEYFTTMHYIHKMLPDNGSNRIPNRIKGYDGE